MHAAVVTTWGQTPKYVEIPDASSPDSESLQIRVQAIGLHAVVDSRATGTHYSAQTLPHVPGVDGVGTTTDGRVVYFSTFRTGGSFAEVVNVDARAAFPLPEGVDPVQAAAFLNPGLSSWMALKMRAEKLPANFTVLIMGATSASGTIAIPLARAFGAGKVIGCARNVEALEKLGLDATIALQTPASETDFAAANEADVILDYLYGPPAEHLLGALECSKPVQYIHIGGLAGQEMRLPGSVLRSKKLTIRGSGAGAFTHRDMAAEVPGLLEAFRGVGPLPVRISPLSEVEAVWRERGEERIVFVA